ncbi:hypothetical protein BCQ_0588 [Bacillus cereus Q1]|uniref:Uncharacterized protein n=1 Tax=Bacillus cereus (strain Q1) TaxID=361100 RepID=B9J3P3_BACCQ|nr:hypothetical protein BCQ_0588 [Bacillus cereus Q1]
MEVTSTRNVRYLIVVDMQFFRYLTAIEYTKLSVI